MDLNLELRDQKRFKYKADIFCENFLPGIIYIAKMYNFGNGGLYFESDQRHNTGDHINLAIKSSSHSFGNDILYQFGIEIIWREDLHDSSFSYGYGAKLIDSNEFLKKIFDISNLKIWSLQDGDLKDEKDLRQHPRKRYNRFAFLSSQNRYYKGVISNISRAGCFIETREISNNNKILSLVIPGDKIDEYIMLKAKIVRLSPTGIGVKFMNQSRKKYQKNLQNIYSGSS